MRSPAPNHSPDILDVQLKLFRRRSLRPQRIKQVFKRKAVVPPGTVFASTEVSGNRSAYFASLTAATLWLILPLWTVSMLPWLDFGDHLGRVFILAHYSDVAVFQQTYELKRLPLPNLAIDLIAPPLLRFFSPDIAGKVFATLSVVVFCLGCHLFGWAVHGKPTWSAIPAVFYFYNSFLIWGFVNFMWGVSLFLITAAIWVRFERKPSWAMLALAMAGAMATYFAHLMGFVFLCCFMGLHVSYSMLKTRRILVPQFMSAAVVPLPGFAAYIMLGPTERRIGVIAWTAFSTKLQHLWVLFAGYSTWMDVVVFTGLAVVILAVVRYGTVTIDPKYLIISGAFLLAFLVLPTEFLTGTETDTRFFLPCALVATLAAEIRLPLRMMRLVGALAILTLAGRIAMMTWYWQDADRASQEQRALLKKVDEGSRIFAMVFPPPGRTAEKTHQHMNHMTGYATIDRNAISGSAETYPGQQLIRLRVPLPYQNSFVGATVNMYPWAGILSAYDYVWAYNLPPDFVAFLRRYSDDVGDAGMGRLFRIRHL